MFVLEKILIILLALLTATSCTYFNKLSTQYTIYESQYTNKDIIFADISKVLIKEKKINENWSKLHSNQSIPYFKLKNSSGKILGNSLVNHDKYLVVKLYNNKKIKWKYDYGKDDFLPSHIALYDDVKKAKKYIGNEIWLNNIFADSIFMDELGRDFEKFERVKVVGVKIYQNSKVDIPVWLKIEVRNQYNSYIRFHDKFRFKSRQNNYFIENPIKYEWGKEIIKKIIKGKIDFGMTHDQVRLSLGNPDVINQTSSRHGVSQQWIFGKSLDKKRYLTFENGKLSSM